jgi:hypothetical protein
MKVAAIYSFSVDKKEQVGAMLKRFHTLIKEECHHEPLIEFAFTDAWRESESSASRGISSIERVLKRFSELKRFQTSIRMPHSGYVAHQLTNKIYTSENLQSIEFETHQAIAKGVPKSFPFHEYSITLHSKIFGEGRAYILGSLQCSGLRIEDSWSISGRRRALTLFTIVEVGRDSAAMPRSEETVARILSLCGKVRKTTHIPLEAAGIGELRPASLSQEKRNAVDRIFSDAEANIAGIIDRAQLPYDLPSPKDILNDEVPNNILGPLKPSLASAFRPLGYSCLGASGTFFLRRKTSSNITVELNIDVGTWYRAASVFFKMEGLGFCNQLTLPVTKSAVGKHQYKFNDLRRWQQIVDNLAALTKELDLTFVPQVENIAGPSPDWFLPS